MMEISGFHRPRQARSRATLEALTEAVEALIVEPGVEDVPVRTLVERAGTSVGAFYARFDDRDSALAYASHDFWARSRRLWVEYLEPARWETATAARIMVTVVRTFTRMMQADRRRVRAFVRLTLSVHGGNLAGRVGEHDRFVASAMAELMTKGVGEIRHPEPRSAAEEGFRWVLGAVRDRVVFDLDEQDRSADRRWILTLCQMYGRYLDVHPIPSTYRDLLRMTYPREPLGGASPD